MPHGPRASVADVSQSQALQLQLREPAHILMKRVKGWKCHTNLPSGLGIKEAHEELVECLGIQLLVEGELILKEGSSHYAAPQEAQRAYFNRLVHPSHRPFCTLQCILRAIKLSSSACFLIERASQTTAGQQTAAQGKARRSAFSASDSEQGGLRV